MFEGIKPDLLECLIKSTILGPNYTFRYLSGFLQNRDCSQHYYCDAMLQRISICLGILSFLDGTNALDLES